MTRKHEWFADLLWLCGTLTMGATLGLLFWLAAVSVGWTHEAPTGWTYHLGCCSNQDCNELPGSAVQERDGGFVVTVGPEENNQLIEKTTYFVAYDDTRIREPKDGYYHACFSKQYVMNGKMEGGRLLCLYVPPRGF
jgi:hypothetical protein